MKKQPKRHELTAEERAEAARLKALWEAFKEQTPGASQEWLGRTAGIGGQSVVSQYMRGDLALNFANLVKFANVLKFDLAAVSPRLVAEHLDIPNSQADIFSHGRLPASGRKGDLENKGQNRPLSVEARELIRCVAHLDRQSTSSKQSFRLVTGLLLLATASNEIQDGRTAEELVREAERTAAEILAETTEARQENAPHTRKSR